VITIRDMKKILLFLPIFFSFAVSLAQYIPNETVNIIAQVSDVWGNPIDDANCSAYIFDPDFNLIFSSSLEYKNGFYVSNFTVPSRYGTYLKYVECNVTLYGKPKTIKSAKTFFVSSAFDVIERQLREYVSNVSINVTLNITGNLTEAVSQAQEDIIGLLLALHSTPQTTSYCYNSTHRVVVKTATWRINDKDYNITKHELEFCERGCNNETGECVMPISTAFVWAIGIIIIGIILYVIFRAVV
jgi:hypothetical protein